MRMRRKKWAEPYLEAHPEYVLFDPRDLKGQWHELFRCTRLHVEIGTGKGDYLNAMAAMYPQEGWVGIERDHSAAAVAARKALERENADISSKRLIVHNAEDLLDWFAPGEIEVIHLNFSDPWPKTYTHKRRLSSERFLKMYQVVLAPEGVIRMKTDNRDLFQDSVLYFQNGGFRFTEFSLDYRSHAHPEDAVTEYERKFMDLGQPIYQLAAVRAEGNMVK
jgi:tRNA (guanine-N7-)-methyltransferase